MVLQERTKKEVNEEYGDGGRCTRVRRCCDLTQQRRRTLIVTSKFELYMSGKRYAPELRAQDTVYRPRAVTGVLLSLLVCMLDV